MNHEELAHMRRNYIKDGLLEEQAPAEPYALFDLWLDQAVATELPPTEPNAMTLATVGAQGQPHCRVLLLKDFDTRGFVFYTNYQSNKGLEIEQNPQAAMTFFWPVLERQVRIEGRLEKVSTQESDEYYQVRPLGSRIGAWASPQSRPLRDRAELEEKVAQAQSRFQQEPPRPPHWGGYKLVAHSIEFWQGRPDRLHDRLLYLKQGENGWLLQRLAP